MEPLVTVLIPNYKTLELTQLCLRLLRKHTNPTLARFIVIDNDSQDKSLDYLRTLKWIDLIERPSIPGESPALSHARALDLGLARVTTPYVLSIHTDTLVKHSKWLEFLLEKIAKNPQIAGVGSWKLESKSWLKRSLKIIEQQLQLLYYRLLGKTSHTIAGQGKNYYYLRSHCALYRMDLIQKFSLGFASVEEVAGKRLHKELVDKGYQMIFLPSEQLGQYIDHINHATMVLNPELGARQKTIRQGQRRLAQRLKAVLADEILQDASLDA
jgi:hypothetical protein